LVAFLALGGTTDLAAGDTQASAYAAERDVVSWPYGGYERRDVAPGTLQLKGCVAGYDCSGVDGDLKHIARVEQAKWLTWGGETATGTGNLTLALPSEPSSQPITVELSKPERCAGRRFDTRYTIVAAAGAPPLPKGFQQVRTYPCIVKAGPIYGRRSDAHMVSDADDLHERDGVCILHLLQKQGYPTWCQMKWRGWGTSKVIGAGVLRDNFGRQWASEVTLSRPSWCRLGVTWANTYSRMTYTTWGRSEAITGTATQRVGRRLRKRVTNRVGARRTYKPSVVKACLPEAR
jgi:hypothetical protein